MEFRRDSDLFVTGGCDPQGNPVGNGKIPQSEREFQDEIRERMLATRIAMAHDDVAERMQYAAR